MSVMFVCICVISCLVCLFIYKQVYAQTSVCINVSLCTHKCMYTQVYVVEHNLDLHFQGHTFFKCEYLKTVRASKKFSGVNFLEVDVCRRMAPW